jgi:hypothetical protein
METEAFLLSIGRFIQIPSIAMEKLEEEIARLKKVLFARSAKALSSVLEDLIIAEEFTALLILNQALTKQFAFQLHPVLLDKSQLLVYALLVLQGPSIALVEPLQKPRAVLAKFPTLVQQLVYGIIQRSVQLVHTSTHLLHRPILTAQLVPQVVIVWEVLLLQSLALRVK